MICLSSFKIARFTLHSTFIIHTPHSGFPIDIHVAEFEVMSEGCEVTVKSLAWVAFQKESYDISNPLKLSYVYDLLLETGPWSKSLLWESSVLSRPPRYFTGPVFARFARRVQEG